MKKECLMNQIVLHLKFPMLCLLLGMGKKTVKLIGSSKTGKISEHICLIGLIFDKFLVGDHTGVLVDILRWLKIKQTNVA